jgi:hypothetical protein
LGFHFRYEREEDRIQDKKPVKEQFLPLADVPEIQKVKIILNKDPFYTIKIYPCANKNGFLTNVSGSITEKEIVIYNKPVMASYII